MLLFVTNDGFGNEEDGPLPVDHHTLSGVAQLLLSLGRSWGHTEQCWLQLAWLS